MDENMSLIISTLVCLWMDENMSLIISVFVEWMDENMSLIISTLVFVDTVNGWKYVINN